MAGSVLGNPRLRWGRLQGFLALVHGLGILAGWYFAPIPEENYMGVLGGMFVSFSMGVQNTITSLFSPFTLRTSHHSGTMLDIGIAIGQCVHLRNLDNFWKLKIFVPNYIGFWLGALFGCIACNKWKTGALLFNASFGIIVGVGTLVLCTFFKYREMEQENKPYQEIYQEKEDITSSFLNQERRYSEDNQNVELDNYDEDNITQRRPYYGTI